MSQGSNGHGQQGTHRLSVVVSTYEWPAALDVVLRALFAQSDPDFDVIVADDGSGPDTAALIERWQERFGERLTHSWHDDEGFRAARARNLGALASTSPQTVFLDGDCVPRRNFVRAARAAAVPGWYGVGRRLLLSPELTEQVLADGIPIHDWSTLRWLSGRRHRKGIEFLTTRDRRKVGRVGVPEFVPDLNAYSPLVLATADFESVNGYDMRYEGWGEEDVDLAVRLGRLGLRCGHLGGSGTVLHLWHRSRVVAERPNWWLLQETKNGDALEAVAGLRELERELALAGADELSAAR